MSRRRRVYDPLAPLSPGELNRQANLLLSSALSQPRQKLRNAQAEARRQQQEDQDAIRGFTQALAGILGGIAPNVSRTYGDAATRQAQIAHGYADQQRQVEQGAADQGNAILAAQGQGPRLGASKAADVLYALGGANPANLLNQQGAAATAYAQTLPGLAAGRGQTMLQERIYQGQQEQDKLRTQLEDLMARVPGLRQEILDKLYSRELSKSAADTQRQYLGVSQFNAATSRQAQIDPNTGLPYSYLSDQQGKQNKQNENHAAARKARMDALTSNRDKAWTAAATLRSATMPNPSPNRKARFEHPTVPKYNYQQAYKYLYGRFGQPLMRLAPPNARQWWQHQINVMIQNALTNNGFKRPQNAAQRNRNVAPNNRKITRPGPS